MATEVQTVPQPLTGMEIRKGIAARVSAEVPKEYAEAVKESIFQGLGKTCSLESSCCYSKFKADWNVACWREDEKIEVSWWIQYELDDFGRVTRNRMGNFMGRPLNVEEFSGSIPEVPPDRFRRETEQPIPRPVELKKPEPEASTFSQAPRRGRPRKNV